ncbi:MAG: hypothetical protein QXK07_07920, partial [Desulfurococcaceae archaeon]
MKRAQSEAAGAIVIAALVVLSLALISVAFRQQVAVVRRGEEVAGVVAMRQAESIAFDCRNGAVHALPSVDIDVVAVLVYNDTSLLYANTTRLRLRAGSWTQLVAGSIAEEVCSTRSVLAVVTSTGNLIPWTPPVVVSRTTLVEQVGFLGPARAYSYNDSTVLPVAYELWFYRVGQYDYMGFGPGAVHPVFIVFHGGGGFNATESYRVVQLSSTAFSAEVNLTVSNVYGYFTVSYNYTVSHGMRGSRVNNPYYRTISQSWRVVNESSGLARYKQVVVYVNATQMTTWMYELGDASVLPLVVYVSGGSVSGGRYAVANVVVLNPLTGENATVPVRVFDADFYNMKVGSVYYPVILITAVDPDTGVASSFRFTVAPVTVVSYVSTAGYTVLGSAPATLYYSSNDQEAVATVNESWSISVDNPWVVSWCYTSGGWVECYYNRWTVSAVAFRNMTVPVAMWQYFRADTSRPGQTTVTPTPTPAEPPPPPPPVLSAVIDPYPQSAKPTTVSAYVVSSRYDPNLAATYTVVNEEANVTESSGQLQFSIRSTVLGARYASDPVVLGGDARRRA